MNEARKPSFQVAQTEDGTWLAASTVSPIFCFEEETEDAVIDKAIRAMRFFFGGTGIVTEPPVSKTKHVVGFVPKRRVEFDLEAA